MAGGDPIDDYEAQLSSLMVRLSLHVESEADQTDGVPATAAHSVLIIGDGDLSFAEAAIEVNPQWTMHATVYEPADRCTVDAHRLERLKEHSHSVQYDLDGTTVCKGLDKFGLIIFNFPFVAHDKDSSRHVISRFLVNMERNARPGTEILIGLATQKRDTSHVAYQYGAEPKYSAENIIARAVYDSINRATNPNLIRVKRIPNSRYYNSYLQHGYKHTTTSGGSNHGLWNHNDKTAFHLVVESRTGQAEQRLFEESLSLLLLGCPDRPFDRMPLLSRSSTRSERVFLLSADRHSSSTSWKLSVQPCFERQFERAGLAAIVNFFLVRQGYTLAWVPHDLQNHFESACDANDPTWALNELCRKPMFSELSFEEVKAFIELTCRDGCLSKNCRKLVGKKFLPTEDGAVRSWPGESIDTDFLLAPRREWYEILKTLAPERLIATSDLLTLKDNDRFFTVVADLGAVANACQNFHSELESGRVPTSLLWECLWQDRPEVLDFLKPCIRLEEMFHNCCIIPLLGGCFARLTLACAVDPPPAPKGYAFCDLVPSLRMLGIPFLDKFSLRAPNDSKLAQLLDRLKENGYVVDAYAQVNGEQLLNGKMLPFMDEQAGLRKCLDEATAFEKWHLGICLFACWQKVGCKESRSFHSSTKGVQCIIRALLMSPSQNTNRDMRELYRDVLVKVWRSWRCALILHKAYRKQTPRHPIG